MNRVGGNWRSATYNLIYTNLSLDIPQTFLYTYSTVSNRGFIIMKKSQEFPYILPCPFCGKDIDLQYKRYPVDTLYPATKDFSVWELICSALDGGCDASILGSNKSECIEKWNRRVSK